MEKYKKSFLKFFLFLKAFLSTNVRQSLLIGSILNDADYSSLLELLDTLQKKTYLLIMDDLDNPLISFVVADAARVSKSSTLSLDTFSHNISALKFLFRSLTCIKIKLEPHPMENASAKEKEM